MDIEHLNGLPFAVVLSRLDRTDDDGHMAVLGTAVVRDGQLFLEGKESDVVIPIPKRAWHRIRSVPDDARNIIDVDYSVQLTVAPIEDDEDVSELKPLGLKWVDRTDT